MTMSMYFVVGYYGICLTVHSEQVIDYKFYFHDNQNIFLYTGDLT